MLYGAEVAVYSEINTHKNSVGRMSVPKF